MSHGCSMFSVVGRKRLWDKDKEMRTGKWISIYVLGYPFWTFLKTCHWNAVKKVKMNIFTNLTVLLPHTHTHKQHNQWLFRISIWMVRMEQVGLPIFFLSFFLLKISITSVPVWRKCKLLHWSIRWAGGYHFTGFPLVAICSLERSLKVR